jgi:hypothetical protein
MNPALAKFPKMPPMGGNGAAVLARGIFKSRPAPPSSRRGEWMGVSQDYKETGRRIALTIYLDPSGDYYIKVFAESRKVPGIES